MKIFNFYNFTKICTIYCIGVFRNDKMSDLWETICTYTKRTYGKPSYFPNRDISDRTYVSSKTGIYYDNLSGDFQETKMANIA